MSAVPPPRPRHPLPPPSEAGMSTAEYAVGTLAACAFAGLLLRVLTSDTVSAALSHLVVHALQSAGS
jgi:hypothetical protein